MCSSGVRHSDRLTEQVRSIIARAATLEERFAAPWLEPEVVADPAEVEELLARWIQHTSGGDAQHFEEILRARGIPPEALPLHLQRVRLRLDARLPEWGRALVELVGVERSGPAAREPCGLTFRPEQLEREGDDRDGPIVFLEAFAPFLETASGWLASLAGGPIRISPTGRNGMLHRLAGRWQSCCEQVLYAELRTDGILRRLSAEPGVETPGDLIRRRFTSRSGWVELFDRYPVLGRLVATLYIFWKEECAEMAGRLARDAPLLRDIGLLGTRDDELVSVRGGAGDSHRRGRSVAILEFASGRKLVYKPRSLAIGGAFMELISSLNGAGLSSPLHVRRIVARDDYGFEEFVDGAPRVETGEEVERFFLRAGMSLALLEALEGRDFHSDNVLAQGEHLVLLDLEALFAPRPRDHPDVSASEAAATVLLRESPLLVGLLPDWTVGDAGRAGIPAGALLRGGRWTTPYKVPLVRVPEGEEPYFDSGYNVFEGTPTVPVFRGEPADGSEHVDAILEGYHEMTRLLAEHAGSLADPEGWLERAGALPVRFIPRFTRFYAHFRFESLAPELLADGRERDLFLDRLFRACLDRSDPMVHLVQREVSDIRDLDVPLFQSLPADGAVTCSGGTRILGLLEGCALDRARARVARALDVVDRGADAIRSAFATLESPRPPGRSPERAPSVLSPARVGCPGPEWLLSRASAIGDELIDYASSSAHDRALSWMGLVDIPTAGITVLSVLPADLLSGSAGLSIVFASLARTTGLARFHTAALGALDASLSLMSSARAHWSSASRVDRFFPGAFIGAAAPIHAAARVGRLLGERRLVDEAFTQARALPRERMLAEAPMDLIAGVAGLLLVLLDGLGYGHDPDVDTLVLAIADHMTARWREDGGCARGPYPEGTEPPPGLPDFDAGAAFALLRFARVCSPSKGSWREPAELLARARPTAGNLRARLAAKIDAPETLVADVEGCLAAARASDSSAALVSGMELAASAASSMRRPDYLEIGREMAQLLQERRAAGGRWFPESMAADRHRLSATTGLGAVAHAFIRLALPGHGYGIGLFD